MSLRQSLGRVSVAQELDYAIQVGVCSDLNDLQRPIAHLSREKENPIII